MPTITTFVGSIASSISLKFSQNSVLADFDRTLPLVQHDTVLLRGVPSNIHGISFGLIIFYGWDDFNAHNRPIIA